MSEVKIEQFPKFFKIGDVIQNPKKLNENELVIVNEFVDGTGKTYDKQILKKNVTRTYAIVYDGYVQKKGKSEAEGGMLSTINWYMHGGLSTKASARTIGVYMDIHKAVLAGKKVEIYMHCEPPVKTSIMNSAGEIITKEFQIASKELERADLDAYKSKAGEYPRMNMQEAHEEWPDSVRLLESHLKGGKEVRDKNYINEILNKEFAQ